MLVKNRDAIVLSFNEAEDIHMLLQAVCDECMAGLGGPEGAGHDCECCRCGYLSDRMGMLLRTIKEKRNESTLQKQ